MELKFFINSNFRQQSSVLIIPYGIEMYTKSGVVNASLVLIIPYGIEIFLKNQTTVS